MRRLLVVALAVLMVMGMVASAAFAGEVTGNGKDLSTGSFLVDGVEHHTLHGKSACAFSGLEDWASAEPQPNGEILVVPGVTQSWGQIPKADRDFLTSIGMSPGQACNPTSGFEE